MFLKGLMVGLFIGAVIGFFSACMMAVSHTQEKKMDAHGAMMAQSMTPSEFRKEFREWLKTASPANGCCSPYTFDEWLVRRNEVDHG